MTYKTILVHAGLDAEAPVRLRAALSIGDRFGAEVIGVSSLAWDPYVIDAGVGFVSGETVELMREKVDQDLAAAETAFRAAGKDYRHGLGWRTGYDFPGRTMGELSRCADLIVASQAQKGVDLRHAPSPTDLIMASGLPVVVLPKGQDQAQIRNVLIAWKNTRETRRAVSDALPFLKLAERVHVAAIVESGDVETARVELADVVERLARHGVKAEPSAKSQLGDAVSDDLTTLAQTVSAELVVAGAYGHARLREWAFGGVTSELIAFAPRPVLFSR